MISDSFYLIKALMINDIFSKNIKIHKHLNQNDSRTCVSYFLTIPSPAFPFSYFQQNIFS